MPQIKKPEIREAILEAAFELFCRNGYTNTKMSQIAAAADTTTGNLYAYFDSKLLLLHEIYNPWLLQQLGLLRASAQKYRSPRSRIRRIFVGLWQDIPMADHSFANTWIEALAGVPKDAGRMTDSLFQVEEFVRGMLEEYLPPDRRASLDIRLVTRMTWMAFDGFAINFHFGERSNVRDIADMMASFLLGETAGSKTKG